MTGSDTIAAIATPPGTGGVGIVRVSGADAFSICRKICGDCPPARTATLRKFRDIDGNVVDHGLILSFASPSSFTGEDLVEFQGHGGAMVLDMLLEAVLAAGARIARPGEFSERAFLNDRIDLVQAEAIADLIESGTRSGARLALRSLEGEFSSRVDEIAADMNGVRMYVEAAIDFPEEEIDFLADSDAGHRISTLIERLESLIGRCDRGSILRDGLNVVLCGAPNAGKSSLLNRLSGKARAIVTDTPGTTRDLLDENIQIGGVRLNLTDTAGLRDDAGPIEQEGIRRARGAMRQADLVVMVRDASETATGDDKGLRHDLPEDVPILTVWNKIDLTGQEAGVNLDDDLELYVSAKHGSGIDALESRLSEFALGDYREENLILARRRHLDALTRALEHVRNANQRLISGAGELVAEELRLGHEFLGQITGRVSSDDLLGQIFSSFCIGK